ncbi:hypothetical protein KSP39_PZI016886 [Platanthera zijinensis]|uniref:Uncharacterized protein n=1 Tax=Platanthera zijinensis TaxID=2320716 RepID=A0AAP0B6U1_9ASPA
MRTMRTRRGLFFKSPHDPVTYEISRKIWSSTFSRKPKIAGVSGSDAVLFPSGLVFRRVSASPPMPAEKGGSAPPPVKEA